MVSAKLKCLSPMSAYPTNTRMSAPVTKSTAGDPAPNRSFDHTPSAAPAVEPSPDTPRPQANVATAARGLRPATAMSTSHATMSKSALPAASSVTLPTAAYAPPADHQQHRNLRQQIGRKRPPREQHVQRHRGHGHDAQEVGYRHAAHLAEAQRVAERHAEQEQAHEQLAGQRQERGRLGHGEVGRSLAAFRGLQHGQRLAPHQHRAGSCRNHPHQGRHRVFRDERQRNASSRLAHLQARGCRTHHHDGPSTPDGQRASCGGKRHRAAGVQPCRQQCRAHRKQHEATRRERSHAQKRRPERGHKAHRNERSGIGQHGHVASVGEHRVKAREHHHIHERRGEQHAQKRRTHPPERRGEQGGGLFRGSGHARHCSMHGFPNRCAAAGKAQQTATPRRSSGASPKGGKAAGSGERGKESEPAAGVGGWHGRREGERAARKPRGGPAGCGCRRARPAGSMPGRWRPACRRGGRRSSCDHRPGP